MSNGARKGDGKLSDLRRPTRMTQATNNLWLKPSITQEKLGWTLLIREEELRTTAIYDEPGYTRNKQSLGVFVTTDLEFISLPLLFIDLTLYINENN